MAPFAGYDMPIQYTSITAEHLAVREAAGVFDVSHMGEFWVRGAQALDFLQYATLNDAAKLKVGRAQYSMLPNGRGGVVDDIYVYHTGEGEYLVVVNAANIEKDWNHLQSLAKGFRADLEDASESTGLLAVQGPKAAQVLQTLCDVDLSSKRKNDTFTATIAGKPARLARTGYTGEDGFEVFTEAGDLKAVWDALLQAGVTPCGLGARDTLRLEAGFPSTATNSPTRPTPAVPPLAGWSRSTRSSSGRPPCSRAGVKRCWWGCCWKRASPARATWCAPVARGWAGLPPARSRRCSRRVSRWPMSGRGPCPGGWRWRSAAKPTRPRS